MKKSTIQRKKVHIHFDQNDDFVTEQGQQIPISQQLVKRQNQLLQQERHESIIKKPKIDQQQVSQQSRSIPRHTQKLRDFTTVASQIIDDKRQSFKLTKEEQQLFEQQTLKLLQEFLFHPNRNNKCIINNQIANYWILNVQTSIKIKSYLMLYMILFQFEEIQFKFTKIHDLQGQKYHKQILIEKRQKLSTKNQSNQGQYQKFKQNQLKKYLAQYFEWLILNYQRKFQIGKGNMQFWAMALNKREEVALQLINGKNSRQKSRNIYLSNFLMNAQDPLFSSTIQRPKQEKIILNMIKEDLQRLPSCHWILGVNFSVKYFFKKSFEDRVRQSLNPNNIYKQEILEFYHQYHLLCKYFNQSLSSKGQKPQRMNFNFGDHLLQWISLQSGFSNKDQFEVISLNKSICSELLEKAVTEYRIEPQKAQNLILTTFELLERQSTLKIDKKEALISEILYKQPGIANRLGKTYPQIISKLEHRRQTEIPEFFQLLNMRYNNFYKHLLLSQLPIIKNDFLAQLKHLIEIDIKLQDEEVKKRITQIVTSFNIITHWNKNILKSFTSLIEKYHDKLQKSLNSKINEKDQQLRRNLLSEIKSFLIFLKIHLRLESFNIKNLKDLCEFIENAQKRSRVLKFEQKTIKFMKKDILSILFNKNQFNESLLLQLKKDHVVSSKEQPKDTIQPKVPIKQKQKTTLLEKLETFSVGTDYFKNQIQLLKKQIQLMGV